MHIDRATIDAVLADWTTAPVGERVRGGLRLLETMTRHPHDIDAELVASLHAVGLDVEAIEEAANIGWHFNFINRLADAFDFPRANPRQLRIGSRMLDFAAKHTGAPRPSPSHCRGADRIVRPVEIDHGRTLALRSRGVTDPALREAVEAHAASLFGARRSDTVALTEPLRGYVEKLARRAYEITDEDIAALKRAGHDEPAIFELTYVAAFGACTAALERLFGVLYPDHAHPV